MTPIKPGTARRLGLRTPGPRPSLIRFHFPVISEQEAEKFADAFRESRRRLPWPLRAPEPVEFTRRYI